MCLDDQIERAHRKKLRGIKKSWRRGPTLRRFLFCLYRQEYY
ncbi:MAG: hypothetical protein ACTSRZ_17905 [Promethearchaeota archaeon]